MYKQNKLSEYQICRIIDRKMIEMNLTQFHPESDITPLDSRGEELETNSKLNYRDSIYIYIGDKGQCDL